MQNHTLRQAANLLAAILTIAVNGLANALPLNGVTTAEISNRFRVYFMPIGYAFSIWGLIYLGLIAFASFQALPAQRDNPRFRRIGYLFVLSCLANIGWLFLWHYEQIALTLIPMFTLLCSLIAIYLRLEIGRSSVSASEKWLVNAPFSVYLAWITVATIVNVATVLVFLNWNGWGISPEAWAVIMLAAASSIALATTLTRGDIAYLLVFIWAFIGIGNKNGGTPLVRDAAWVATALVVLMIIASPLLNNRRNAIYVASKGREL